jgi:hypothetical protein
MQQQPPSQHDHSRRYLDNKTHTIDNWPQLQQQLHQEQQQQQVPVQRRHVGYMRMLSDPSSIAPLMTSSQVIVGRTRAGGGGERHDRFLVSDKSVSLQHALVEITGDGSVTIADLGSRNGSAQVTALDNRVLAQGVSYIVEHRDVFYFGCCAVLFLLQSSDACDGAAAAAAAAQASDAEAIAHEIILSAASAPPALTTDSVLMSPRHSLAPLNRVDDRTPELSELPLHAAGFISEYDANEALSPSQVLPVAFESRRRNAMPEIKLYEPPADEPDYIYRVASSAKGLKKYLRSKLKREKGEKWGKRFTMAGNFISVLLASMLCVIVPQECGDLDEGKTCTFFQNIDWHSTLSTNCPGPPGDNDCFTNFNRVVLSWNLFSVFCFALLFFFEGRREAWLGKHLDVERSELTDNLVHTRFWLLQGHECVTRSRRLFVLYLATLIVFIFNVIVSGMLILPEKNDAAEAAIGWNDGLGGYYLDYRSVTTFYSSVMLLFLKLLRGTYLLFCICLDKPAVLRIFTWQIAELQPLPWGLSTVDFEPSSYNVVAPEICLKELRASKYDEALVDSWRLRNPNGSQCPRVAVIAPERGCNCSVKRTVESASSQRGFIPMLVQAR